MSGKAPTICWTVHAVVRLAGLLPLACSPVELAEAEVAMGEPSAGRAGLLRFVELEGVRARRTAA